MATETFELNDYWRTITYDERGRAIEWEDSTGQKVSYSYESNTSLAKVKIINPYTPSVVTPRKRKHNTWDK